MDISTRHVDNINSQVYSNVSQVVEMVEPTNEVPTVDADHLGQNANDIEAENSPVSICINPTKQTEPEPGLNGLAKYVHLPLEIFSFV